MPLFPGLSTLPRLSDPPIADRLPTERHRHRSARDADDRRFEKRPDVDMRPRFEDLVVVSQWTGMLPTLPTAVAASAAATTASPGAAADRSLENPAGQSAAARSSAGSVDARQAATTGPIAGDLLIGSTAATVTADNQPLRADASVTTGRAGDTTDGATDVTDSVLEALATASVEEADDAQAAEGADTSDVLVDGDLSSDVGGATGDSVADRITDMESGGTPIGDEASGVGEALQTRSDRSADRGDTRPKAADSGADAATGPRITVESHEAAAAGGMTSATLSDLAAADVRQPLSAQVSRAITAYLRNDPPESESSLRLRLDPPDLGRLTISFRRSEEGLSIRVEAVEHTTLDMLLARGDDIQQQLQRQHLEMRSLEFGAAAFDSASGGSTSQHDRSGHSPEPFRNGHIREASRTASADVTRGRSAGPSELISIRA